MIYFAVVVWHNLMDRYFGCEEVVSASIHLVKEEEEERILFETSIANYGNK